MTDYAAKMTGQVYILRIYLDEATYILATSYPQCPESRITESHTF